MKPYSEAELIALERGDGKVHHSDSDTPIADHFTWWIREMERVSGLVLPIVSMEPAYYEGVIYTYELMMGTISDIKAGRISKEQGDARLYAAKAECLALMRKRAGRAEVPVQ